MEQLTIEERTEWTSDATDAIRGRMLLRMLSAEEAYTTLACERAWRDELPSAVLRAAYEEMTAEAEH